MAFIDCNVHRTLCILEKMSVNYFELYKTSTTHPRRLRRMIVMWDNENVLRIYFSVRIVVTALCEKYEYEGFMKTKGDWLQPVYIYFVFTPVSFLPALAIYNTLIFILHNSIFCFVPILDAKCNHSADIILHPSVWGERPGTKKTNQLCDLSLKAYMPHYSKEKYWVIKTCFPLHYAVLMQGSDDTMPEQHRHQPFLSSAPQW